MSNTFWEMVASNGKLENICLGLLSAVVRLEKKNRQRKGKLWKRENVPNDSAAMPKPKHAEAASDVSHNSWDMIQHIHAARFWPTPSGQAVSCVFDRWLLISCLGHTSVGALSTVRYMQHGGRSQAVLKPSCIFSATYAPWTSATPAVTGYLLEN